MNRIKQRDGKHTDISKITQAHKHNKVRDNTEKAKSYHSISSMLMK